MFLLFFPGKNFRKFGCFFFTIYVKKIRLSVNKKANGEIKQKFYRLEIDFKFKISQRKKKFTFDPVFSNSVSFILKTTNITGS